MNNAEKKGTIQFGITQAHCPIGETIGNRNMKESRIPVLSCEGACIRGEIARLAANMISRENGFGRGCHGELITVPESAIAKWINEADKVLLIDGCFLRCHGRILENLIPGDKLIQFDALSHYNRYSDIFDYDDVPEQDRLDVARSVADWVLENLDNPSAVASSSCSGAQPTNCCEQPAKCCG